MPSWWGKFSSKNEKKKANQESFIDAINRKFRISSEERSRNKPAGTRGRNKGSVSDRGFLSRVPSRSPSPSTCVSRCQSFAERPQAQPLPLPDRNFATISRTDSGISASAKPEFDGGSKPLMFLPLPKPSCILGGNANSEADLITDSVSSNCSIDSDDPSESRLLSPLASDYENGSKTAMSSPSSILPKDRTVVACKSSQEKKRADFYNNQSNQSISTKRRPLSSHVKNLQIPQRGAFCSAPDSSMSSPSRSPMRSFGADQILNCSPWVGKPYHDAAVLGSGQCSSPGSGYNSGQNSVGGDLSGQLLWPQSRCSPECSPVPSPRMTSPGPSSRIQSGAVTPLHHRVGGPASELSTKRLNDSRQQSHQLPLPPLTICNTCPFSPTYSAATSPSVPRSPARTETPAGPGSRWKKGRLLGRGTFGHVYVGFDSESGEMCAMKEVTLFSDDAKSKESAQQLGQEIALLSRLRHPNIVQYYGSETVDDKIYIYLEYVSGGSVYKLLQEYGQFGENAIRNYTQQILSGLAYLHAKNTVHRDIKGANILVDPCGRVKLADFGMAKHITGQSCPLSLKGSPYWMAPEVIKNSSGCNRAVDIWSLGCTVLEMATTKPPWSQYEGVAAMFKIGNSKELPEIPDHLSYEAKEFVRLCLDRNPSSRPTAAQLLEHPFVKNAAPLERAISRAEPSETPILAATLRSPGGGNSRILPYVDSGDIGNHRSKGLKAGAASSTSQTSRNASLPVSPIGSPIPNSRSPRHMSERMSPSPISSPHTASGSSTPLAGGGGAIPFHHQSQPPAYSHEAPGIISRPHSSMFGGNSYQQGNSDLSQGNFYQQQPACVFREMIASDNGQTALADHVSQQLLREHLKLKQFPDAKLSSTPNRSHVI